MVEEAWFNPRSSHTKDSKSSTQIYLSILTIHSLKENVYTGEQIEWSKVLSKTRRVGSNSRYYLISSLDTIITTVFRLDMELYQNNIVNTLWYFYVIPKVQIKRTF